ncbi:MAG: GAF domain-containing protein [Anaerolineales bacterium]|nr:GAF domain-containing protein [Anaerolineales bacterium]
MNQDLTTLFQSLRAESKEPGNLSDILNRIAKTARDYFQPDLCVIFPMNPITGMFLRETPTHKGKIIAHDEKFDYPSKGGLTKTILKNKILAIQNLTGVYSSPKVEAEKIKSVIGIGLYTKKHDKPLAVMYLDYRKPRKFSRKFINDLSLFAEIASSELQTTWFIRRYREIVKIAQNINENLDIKQGRLNINRMFEIVLQHIKGILDVSYYFSLADYDFRKDKANLYFVDEGKQKVRKNYQLKKTSFSKWALTHLKTIAIGDFRKTKLPKGTKVSHIARTASKDRSGIFVPIKIGDKPLGVLSIQHWRANYYDEEDKQLLELLANHISLAVNNYRLLNDLRELDTSGQVLTAELDPRQNILEEVVDRIQQTTQADLITLYPYLHSEKKYLQPIFKGDFFDLKSLKEGEAVPEAIVYLGSHIDEAIFAETSSDLYYKLGKNYQEGGRFPDREKVLSTAALPLRAGVEPIGVLFVNYRTKQNFDLAQQWVINSLATYAAIAIRNSRQFQSLRERRLSELNDLRQIDQAISKSLNSQEILQTILDLSAKYIKADTGLVLLHNKKTNALEPHATIGEITADNDNLIVSLGRQEGIANIAFKEKQTIRIDNVTTDPRWKDKFIKVTKNTISEMDIPLILDNVAIGVMNFESNRERAFSDDDQNFMETLAGQAVIVVRNAIEYERAQRIAVERKALIDIVNTFLFLEDPDAIFSNILKEALKITETEKGTISRCDDRRREITIVAQHGLREDWPKIQSFDKGVVGKAVREGKPIKIDRVSEDPLKDLFLDAFPGAEESELVVPIRDGGKVIGVINLESENPFHFEEDDIELVSSLASLCAVAIKNLENLSQKKLASVGAITGNLSHKMNSPLDLIRKQVEFIEQNCSTELSNNKYLADKITTIGEIAAETTDVVKTLIEEAKRSFGNLEKISLKDSLESASAELDLSGNSIQLIENIRENPESLLALATYDLSNVFLNLMDNAIRHMPEGGTIYITIENMDEDSYTVSVEDTGDGVPVHMISSIFLPISDQESAGHGFGLPLVKAYLEWIGGQISTPDRGRNGKYTKFTIKLKRA